jgi:hypothetical protein
MRRCCTVLRKIARHWPISPTRIRQRSEQGAQATDGRRVVNLRPTALAVDALATRFELNSPRCDGRESGRVATNPLSGCRVERQALYRPGQKLQTRESITYKTNCNAILRYGFRRSTPWPER